MKIETFFDDRTSTLTYVVFDEGTKDAVIIDPVLDYEPGGGKLWTDSLEKVAAFVDGQQLKVHYVMETHVHADHLSGSQWLKKRYGAKIAVSQRITEVQGVFKDVFNWPQFPTDGRQFDTLLKDDQVLKAGALELTALATPGHTPACMSFKVGDAVFTGDALFFTTRDVGEGAGQSLAIARTVMERHHGRITYEPNAAGGATFTLCLPLPVDASLWD